MSTPRPDDPERDPWLGEALRHAPDAQAAPPAALTEAILRQARAATRTGGARSGKPRSPLAAAWAWLVRPPVAAGFASLLIATTVGVMWWDRPLDETLAHPPAAAIAPPPAAAPAVEGSTSTSEPVAPPSSAVDTGADAAAAAARERPAARQQPAKRAESGAPSVAPVRERDRAARAKTAPAPAPDSTPAPSPAPPASGETTAADSRDTPRPAEPALLSRVAPQAARSAAFAGQPAGARERRPAALGALLEAVASQPERWSWQRAGAIQPMNPALQRWLVQLDAATASRWRPSTDPAAPPTASVLRLYRDGTLTATLALTDDVVWLAPASQAALPAASVAALKQALDDAAP